VVATQQQQQQQHQLVNSWLQHFLVCAVYEHVTKRTFHIKNQRTEATPVCMKTPIVNSSHMLSAHGFFHVLSD
jgi:hypothetical protein